MPAKPSDAALTCMSCGTPIKSGFFCARCQSGEGGDLEVVNKGGGKAQAKGKNDAWKGSRFSGEAKKQRQKEMLKEDLAIWGKRLVIVAVLAGIGFAVYSLWGDRIVAWVNNARGVTAPREKFDPTKDASANEDDQAQANGQRAFTKAAK